MCVPDQDQLVAFDFLSHSCPRYGALLCFGQNPQKWLSGSLTRCIHWRGNTWDDGWLDDQEIRGNLLKQFEFSLGFLRKCLRFSRLIDQERRTEQYEIPFIALEEALANALVHREYSNRTDFIQIEVFDDRIEFRSPGDLPAPMTLDLLGVENKCHPRNPIIARIFYLCGYVEKVGSGVQRMQNMMKKADLPPPKLELSGAKTLTVTLYRPLQISDLSSASAIVEPEPQETQLEDTHNEDVKPLSSQIASPLDKRSTSRGRFNFSFGIKIICPSCFEEIFLGECKIVSNISGKILEDPGKGLLARSQVKPLTGRGYTLEQAHRQCPNCNYLLPPNIEQVPNITLAVVGDTNSGKSHYIASLIHQMQTEWVGSASNFARITSLTPATEREYTRNYFEPLFIQKRSLPATSLAEKPTQDPLIYQLVVGQKVFNLMIYDAAGEDLMDSSRLINNARFVLNTSAFIFTVDPLTLPIFEQLPHHIQTSLQFQFEWAQRRRATDLLNHIMNTVERYRERPSGSGFPDIPIAVMITKADLFKYTFTQSGKAIFMKNPRYGAGINLRDVAMVDQEIRTLLRTYSQMALLASTGTFEHVSFFCYFRNGRAS